MNLRRSIIPLLAASLTPLLAAVAQPRPRLVITGEDVRILREGRGAYPLFDRSFAEATATLDTALAHPPDVPLPQDAGGPVHERHKKNYAEMQLAGVLYAVTGEERYARFVRDELLLYAKIYPGLRTHPKAISAGSSGRLFWQTLNDMVWLVHVAQAYDCVYDWIPPEDRKTIEQRLFRPMARFLSVEREEDLDRIHNHGTWMVAAVGLLGYTLRDSVLVSKALYGSRRDGKAGYFRQLDLLFSPDGYYAEGAYYARYALMPFYLLALAIEHNQPELKVFAYRDGILRKALLSTLQLTNTNGEFFPFNDALKGMSSAARELVLAVDVVYGRYRQDPGLLSVAARQGRVQLGANGLTLARDLAGAGRPSEFPYGSLELRDGPAGDRGGIGLLRSAGATTLLMKYGSQGMGHGHFDRLTFLYYDQGREIIQDYGAARWINIEPKFGGRYLPENKTWAKQTIAHNTVAVDELSHYRGNTDDGERNPGQRRFFQTADSMFQVMSGAAVEVVPGVRLERTMALVRDPRLPHPVVLDLVRATSAAEHRYDLPFYYQGQLISTTVPYKAFDRERRALGTRNGYQHLWLEAEGVDSAGIQFTWLNENRYYTVTSTVDSSPSVLFARIGAGDPEFNLRNEPAAILRTGGKNRVFASVIEPHGFFDPVEEISTDARPSIRSVRILGSTEEGTVVEIRGKGGLRWLWGISGGPASETARHQIVTSEGAVAWTGNTFLERKP
jgi:oligo-alginate lyase